MNKKYLLLSEIFPPKTGGSGRWFWDLYTRVGGQDVIVVTDKAEDAAGSDSDSGLVTHRVRMASESWGILRLKGIVFYIILIAQVIKLARKYNVESIHCGRTLPEGVVAMIVKLLTGTPYHCYVHGEDIEMCRSSREFTFLVKMVIRYANKLICNSENSANLLRQWWNAKEHQICVLHPGVDASAFTPPLADSVTDLLPGRRVIVTVSRLQPRKGHDVLIKAMPRILQQHPDITYAIVGSGKQENVLRQLIDELAIGDSVILLGECSEAEMKRWYQRSDLFVLPNRQIGNDVEGFGIVLLEAQACGTPVIAGDSGGTKETMEIGKTGYVLDCSSPEGLVTLISNLFADPKQLATMGAEARERILQVFDWPRVIESATELFEVERRG
ncbi:MAG: glycosyltransferase family 4 protein [Pseudomonadales bacterium]